MEVKIPFMYDESRNIIKQDMGQVSNVLIAGTTGTGKTAFIQSLLCRIADTYSCENVKFIIIDTKGFEYAGFNGLQHMLTPVITDIKKTNTVIDWLIADMNERKKSGRCEPELFVVIDDYATLQMSTYIDIGCFMELLQQSRAFGLHFWFVTSIPSAKLISSELKVNMPYRVAFNVPSRNISRMIVDANGAEQLKIPGEIIYKAFNRYARGESIYIEESEIDGKLKEMRRQEKSESDILKEHDRKEDDTYDMYLIEAGKYIIEKEKASIGMLQRYFKVSFNRAARIVDQLYEIGLLGPDEGIKPRKILMTEEQFEECTKQMCRNTETAGRTELKSINTMADVKKSAMDMLGEAAVTAFGRGGR